MTRAEAIKALEIAWDIVEERGVGIDPKAHQQEWRDICEALGFDD